MIGKELFLSLWKLLKDKEEIEFGKYRVQIEDDYGYLQWITIEDKSENCVIASFESDGKNVYEVDISNWDDLEEFQKIYKS